MKKTLLLLSLLVAGIAQAQVVNIPDPAFKEFLLNYNTPEMGPLDVNADGEIQIDEALSISNLETNAHLPIASLEGIEVFTNLASLTIHCEVTGLDLSSLTQLTTIKLYTPELVDLNINGLTGLQNVEIRSSNIAALDFSEITGIQSLIIYSSNSLASLIIGEHPFFTHLEIVTYHLSELDLSGCPNLAYIDLRLLGNGTLFINLKNGNNQLTEGSNIYLESLSSRCYICIDEGEEESFTWFGWVVSNPYCTFTPGGGYNVITGSLLFDNDGNCDTSGTVISNIKLNINDGTESGSIISSTGLYNFFTQAGTFTVTPDFENDFFTITPPFAEISFTEVDSLVTTQNFCLTPNGSHPDLDIVIVPFGARPGFDANYKII